VEVRDYRGQRGGEIVSTNHLRQYVGKKPGHPLRLGDDIDGVSGATWSSRSLADAVRDIVTRAVDFDAGS
jgi:hypothetical protein